MLRQCLEAVWKFSRAENILLLSTIRLHQFFDSKGSWKESMLKFLYCLQSNSVKYACLGCSYASISQESDISPEIGKQEIDDCFNEL